MIRTVLIAAIAAGLSAIAAAEAPTIQATPPDAVIWIAPPGAKDGRERAVLHGDPDAGSAFWTYRVRTPGPIRVEAHTHSVDEFITVLEGAWFLGYGQRFDPAGLKAYPPGTFVRIPAGAPHFVATGEGVTIIQSSGSGQFRTEFAPLK